MTTATLKSVGRVSDPWGDNNLIFVDLVFYDHAPATLTTNPQGKDARLRELAERMGKAEDWEFGTSKAGKPTAKIPKAEGDDWKSKSGKWQPRPIAERHEMMAESMLKSAVALCAVRDSSLTLAQAVTKVEDAMTSFLAYARGALQDVGAPVQQLSTAAGTETERTVASTNRSEAFKGSGTAPAAQAEPRKAEATAGSLIASEHSSTGPSVPASPHPSEGRPDDTVAGTHPGGSVDSPHAFNGIDPDAFCSKCGGDFFHPDHGNAR